MDTASRDLNLQGVAQYQYLLLLQLNLQAKKNRKLVSACI